MHSASTLRSSVATSILVSLAGFALWTANANSLRVNIKPNSKEEAHHIHSSKFSGSGYSSPSSSTSSVLYDGKYSHLTGNQKTRILILAPGQYGDELKGDLRVIRCLEDHDYEALSYSWGEKVEGYLINCGRDKIQITQNLDAALRNLRFQDQPRVLWVDAISVNQEDTNERNQQIKIFRQIYSNARRVLVWLGEELSEISPFEFLQDFQMKLIKSTNITNFQRLGWYRDEDEQVYSGGSQRAILTSADNQNLIHFLSRDWFHRTWIIQEVACARHAVVICGSHEMEWERFAHLSNWLGQWFLPFNQLGNDIAEQALINIAAIEYTRRSHSGSLELPLFYILLATSLSDCRDKRDKIFAVRDLAKDWKDANVLSSNYSTDLEDVYSEFAIADCNFYGTLRTLSCASGPQSNRFSRLPSWVPDWRRVQNSQPLVRYRDRTGFSASGNTKLEAWYSKDRRTLHVTGIIVDWVVVLGPKSNFSKSISYFELSSKRILDLQQSRKWFMDCYELALDGREKLNKEERDELWRTLICGLTSNAFPAPIWYSEYFEKYMEYIKTVPEKYYEYMIEAQTAPKGIPSMDDTGVSHLHSHVIIESALCKWSKNRRLCKTYASRLACIPEESRPGDVIYIVFGAEVPYILRPDRDGCFEVVGECYVDGIMHGETLSNDTPPRDIQLI